MRIKFIIPLIAVLLLAACSETKYVAEGSYLLDRVKIVPDTTLSDVVPADLKAFVRQRGNSRWFSAVKIPLYTYSLSGRDTTRWLNRMLRSIGEAPVLYDTLLTKASMLSINQQLQNKGYLRSSVSVYNDIKGKKLRTIYLLHPGPAYYLRHVDYDIQDTAISRLLCMDDTLHRGLHGGMKFNVDNLEAERKRITQSASPSC